MTKRGSRIKQYWDPIYGDRKLLRRCVRCTKDCKVYIPYHQKEEELSISVECARTGFHYAPGPTNASERKLDLFESSDL